MDFCSFRPDMRTSNPRQSTYPVQHSRPSTFCRVRAALITAIYRDRPPHNEVLKTAVLKESRPSAEELSKRNVIPSDLQCRKLFRVKTFLVPYDSGKKVCRLPFVLIISSHALREAHFPDSRRWEHCFKMGIYASRLGFFVDYPTFTSFRACKECL